MQKDQQPSDEIKIEMIDIKEKIIQPFLFLKIYAHAHCTYLQIAPADAQTKIYKRLQFLQHTILISVSYILKQAYVER